MAYASCFQYFNIFFVATADFTLSPDKYDETPAECQANESVADIFVHMIHRHSGLI